LTASTIEATALRGRPIQTTQKTEDTVALLQIAEPDMSTAPHEHRLAVGIDLGTTHSLVASVRSGSTDCLPDESGDVILPSVVRYGASGVVAVGSSALQAAAADPVNTIASVKRLMGRGLADIASLRLPYDLQAGDGMVQLNTAAGIKSPVEVSADILKVLRARAELTLGGDLVGAVITVPAYFDEAQRQATKDAARLAGINVLRLLNEPTAAAVAYGLDNQVKGSYAVFDLGGGTFDISVLRLTQGCSRYWPPAGTVRSVAMTSTGHWLTGSASNRAGPCPAAITQHCATCAAGPKNA
jgi:molecular chaperone HscA